MRLYVSGHSKQRRGFTTFVPAGIKVSMYAADGFMLPDYEALTILRTGKGEVRATWEAGDEITNYRLVELDGLDLARETAVKGLKSEGQEFPGVVKVVGSELEAPVLLCAEPEVCDPDTGKHTCQGLLGSLSKGFDELHLVVCRGDRTDYQLYDGEEEHDQRIADFLALDAAQRAAAWEKLPQADQAVMISTDEMLRWFESYTIERFAASRAASAFARYRAFLTLDSETRQLLEEKNEDAFVQQVMAAVVAERLRFVQMKPAIQGKKFTVPDWEALTLESREDLVAIDSHETPYRFGTITTWVLDTPGASLGKRDASTAQIHAHGAAVLTALIAAHRDQEDYCDNVTVECVALGDVALLGDDPSWLPVAIDLVRRGGKVLHLVPQLENAPQPPVFTFDHAASDDGVRAIAAVAAGRFTVAFE
ncbi:MAG: putative adhesin [Catenulispora sp.]